MSEDHYRTLNVSPSATAEEIQSAYRALARRYHPDRNPLPAASTLMATINAAFEVLGEPVKRSAYDRSYQKKAESPIDNVVISAARENLLRQGWTVLGEQPNEFLLKKGSRKVQVALIRFVDQVALRKLLVRASAFCVTLAVHIDPALKIPSDSVVIIDLMHSRLFGGDFPDLTYKELFKNFFSLSQAARSGH
jgi:curved DNA-binding protein CbpA